MNSGRGESRGVSCLDLGVVLREEGFFTMRMLTKSSSDVTWMGDLFCEDLRLLLRLLFGIVSDRQVGKVLG